MGSRGCPHGYHGDHQPAGYRDSGKYSAQMSGRLPGAEKGRQESVLQG